MKIFGIFFESIGFSIKNFLDLVSTQFGIEKRYGIRYKKIGYKKVSGSVSKQFAIGKAYWIWYQKDLVSEEEKIGFGFNQILGLVTHYLNPLSDSFD